MTEQQRREIAARAERLAEIGRAIFRGERLHLRIPVHPDDPDQVVDQVARQDVPALLGRVAELEALCRRLIGRYCIRLDRCGDRWVAYCEECAESGDDQATRAAAESSTVTHAPDCPLRRVEAESQIGGEA